LDVTKRRYLEYLSATLH